MEWIIEIPPINLTNFNRLRYWKMMGFRDMTFCTSPCGNKSCFRQITEEVQEAGNRWWGSEDFPIVTADFKDMCENWKEKEE